MTQTTHPTKQLVRDYMDERTRSDEPQPAPADIRRLLQALTHCPAACAASAAAGLVPDTTT